MTLNQFRPRKVNLNVILPFPSWFSKWSSSRGLPFVVLTAPKHNLLFHDTFAFQRPLAL
jgi:hypothetical protein